MIRPRFLESLLDYQDKGLGKLRLSLQERASQFHEKSSSKIGPLAWV